jgi:hypothetical protein
MSKRPLQTPKRRGLDRRSAGRAALIAVLAAVPFVAIWVYLDLAMRARQMADRAAISTIRCALDFAFVHHRIKNTSSGLVTLATDIPATLDPPVLPPGIVIKGHQLRDRRGNLYNVKPESANAPARILLADGSPGP